MADQGELYSTKDREREDKRGQENEYNGKYKKIINTFKFLLINNVNRLNPAN